MTLYESAIEYSMNRFGEKLTGPIAVTPYGKVSRQLGLLADKDHYRVFDKNSDSAEAYSDSRLDGVGLIVITSESFYNEIYDELLSFGVDPERIVGCQELIDGARVADVEWLQKTFVDARILSFFLGEEADLLALSAGYRVTNFHGYESYSNKMSAYLVDEELEVFLQREAVKIESVISEYLRRLGVAAVTNFETSDLVYLSRLTHYLRLCGSYPEGRGVEPFLRDLLTQYSSYKSRIISSGGDRQFMVLCHQASRTGAPILALELARRFANSGLVISSYLAESGEMYDEFLRLGEVSVLSDLSTANDFDVVFDLRWRLDLISMVERGISVSVLVNSVCASPLLRAFSVPGVDITILANEFYENLPRYYFEKAFFYADRLIFPAKMVVDSLPDDLFTEKEREKTHILPQGIITVDSQTSADVRSNHTDFTVLSIGSLIHRKGVDHFVDVARIFREQVGAEIRFLWVGDPVSSDDSYYRSILEKIESYGLADCLELRPSSSSLSEIYRKSSCFLMLSRADPYPCVVLEAMYYRLPVILFKETVGVSDIVDEDNGASVNYGDCHAVADSVIRFYKDRLDLEVAGDQARKRVKEQRDFELYYKKIFSMIYSRDVCEA